MEQAFTATPVWLTLVVAILAPVASVFVAFVTARLTARRERANLVEIKRGILREERRQAYIEYLCALEELLYLASLGQRDENVHPDLEGVRRNLLKNQARIRLTGRRVLRDTVETTLSNIMGTFEAQNQLAELHKQINVATDENVRVRLQKQHGELYKKVTFFASRYIRLAIKVVTEAMRQTLEVERLLDSDVVKPASRTRALLGSVTKLNVKHPIVSVRSMREYVYDKRHPEEELLGQLVRKLETLADEAP